MVIVFEGIDHSGKSTLSMLFMEYLNTEFKDAQGHPLIHPHLGDFVWTKEPGFSSEEADKLNSPEYKDELLRERLFFVSRSRHQNDMRSGNIVCDRYIWSGIAYAKLFSPKAYQFAKELYLSEDLFIQPDLNILVDTDPFTCHIRGQEESIEMLNKKRQSYLDTMKYIQSPVIVVESVGTPQGTLDSLVKRFTSMIDRYRTFIG